MNFGVLLDPHAASARAACGSALPAKGNADEWFGAMAMRDETRVMMAFGRRQPSVWAFRGGAF